MTTQLYDHEFRPFTIDGDRRIVASEDEWQRVRAFARESGAARIRVPVDVFEPWVGPMVDADGERIAIYKPNNRGITATGFIYMDNPPVNCHWLAMREVRSHLFRLIDEYPGVTWLLETSHPENVAVMMPEALTCQPAYGTCKRLKGHTGQHSQQPEYLPNLWLYAKANTQADADARIPHLLRAPATVLGLVMEPREDVNLRDAFIVGPEGGWEWFGAKRDMIRSVIIRGGAEPMHPDWVRSIIRQCEAAGVPVWFDGWGEWWPFFAKDDDMAAVYEDSAGNSSTSDHGPFPPGFNLDADPKEWEEHRWPRENPNSDGTQSSFRVGAARSGRVIDGREWNQLPEESK